MAQNCYLVTALVPSMRRTSAIAKSGHFAGRGSSSSDADRPKVVCDQSPGLLKGSSFLHHNLARLQGCAIFVLKIEFQCPLWVKIGHMQCKRACPLYLRKRTCAAQ